MMYRLRLALIVVAASLVAGILHYTLPQRDVVLVIDAHERRVDFGANSLFWAEPDAGTAAAGNRDVRFIDAMTPDGAIRVYRNEDTGWGWPPYFKLNSSNLQARAKLLSSSVEAPQWVVMTHYGWRVNALSIYPNAVGIRAVDRPDPPLFPWLNLTILAALAGLAGVAALAMMRAYEAWVEPMLDRFAMARDRLEDRRRVWAARLADWRERLTGGPG